MNAMSFLNFIKENYDFTRATHILARSDLKAYWKNWLTAEIVYSAALHESCDRTQASVVYEDRVVEEEKTSYLRYKPSEGVVSVAKKSHASRSDFSWNYQGQPCYFEIRCSDKHGIVRGTELSKYEEDLHRISAIKQANPNIAIFAIFVFYGALSAPEMEAFERLDNSKRCIYVFDSSLAGSTCISRLVQLRREGKPRVCVAAYAV